MHSFLVKKITMSWAHDKKRAKSRKKETRLCVRRTFVNIITHPNKKSYKKMCKNTEKWCGVGWNRRFFKGKRRMPVKQ